MQYPDRKIWETTTKIETEGSIRFLHELGNIQRAKLEANYGDSSGEG